jgi:hypothetical protein
MRRVEKVPGECIGAPGGVQAEVGHDAVEVLRLQGPCERAQGRAELRAAHDGLQLLGRLRGREGIEKLVHKREWECKRMRV